MDLKREKEIFEEFEAIRLKYHLEANDVSQIYVSQTRKEKEDKLGKIVEANKQYVGNCYKTKSHDSRFPSVDVFLKIISERARNEYCVSALMFYTEPHYWFDYNAHKIHQTGDYYLGQFDFEPIWIDEIPVTSLKKYEEIDEGLFKYELQWLSHKIADMSWYADHYRYGGKLPKDEGWEVKKDEKS